jgi:hypothetical protein
MGDLALLARIFEPPGTDATNPEILLHPTPYARLLGGKAPADFLDIRSRLKSCTVVSCHQGASSRVPDNRAWRVLALELTEEHEGRRDVPVAQSQAEGRGG